MFFLDLDGSTEDPVVAEAIDGLRTKAESVRTLGSYPVNTAGVPAGPPRRLARIRPTMDRQATRANGHRAQPDRISVAGAQGAGRGRVLVLNATYEPINVCTVRRATVLVLKSKAEIVEHGDDRLRSERMALDRPVVIRLITYVLVPRDVHRRKITRKAVLAVTRGHASTAASASPG